MARRGASERRGIERRRTQASCGERRGRRGRTAWATSQVRDAGHSASVDLNASGAMVAVGGAVESKDAWGGMTRRAAGGVLPADVPLAADGRPRDCAEAAAEDLFQISCAGHEALLVAAGLAMRPGYDWFFPYYRDRAICLALGNTVDDQMLQAVGAADDPASGGRQMPSHWSSTKLHIVSSSSATATQCLHAIGCAEAGRYFARHGNAAAKKDGAEFWRLSRLQGRELPGRRGGVCVYRRGSTSQGEFWESLNTASNGKLPVVYVIEDNEYAISTPVEANTPGGNISRLVAKFLPIFTSRRSMGLIRLPAQAMVEAVAYARAGHGPAMVHGHVTRAVQPLVERRRCGQYRSEEEVQAETARDPNVRRCRCGCCARGYWTRRGSTGLEQKVDEEVQRATDARAGGGAAQREAGGDPEHQYSEDLRPTDARFATEPKATADASERTMAELLNHCLKDEMRRDERIVVFRRGRG